MQAAALTIPQDRILQTLKTYSGFESLRPLQAEVIDAALANRDAVVVMPTGGGKSLCFQLPSLVTESLTVVVSPLIALMKDQVDGLTIIGAPAAALNSSATREEESEVRRKLVAGRIRLLYLSPERLVMADTMRLLANADNGRGVARFAIDEAHCISAWGHDFRPEYRQLAQIKEAFPGVSVQAFTATATPKVQRDIAIQLKLERPRRFVGVFDRPNLTYRVVAKDDPVQRTVEAVRRYPDEGVIVYSLSRKDTESLANGLIANGIPAVAYHAGLPIDLRKKISEDFAQERANVIVATIAFGMGIDRSNVRCVIHECLPKSMEGYQQETGRAGRDGMPSECTLLYSYSDVVRLKRLLSEGDSEVVARNARLLDEVRRYATSHLCRHKALSEHFGQAYEIPAQGCGACDVCEGGMEALAGSTKIAHQILSTVSDLLRRGRGRSFGIGHLVAVLSGSRAKAVTDRDGQLAEGFGSFSRESVQRITSWVHQLCDLGLLDLSEGQYPVVSVTEEGRLALSEAREIRLLENIALLPAAATRKGVIDSAPSNMDADLFEKLRFWRRSVAAERGVPAYVVFHDAALMRVAAIRPSTIDRLRAISGIGAHRAVEFGDQLVGLVREHCDATGAVCDEALSSQPKPAAAPTSAKSSRYAAHFRAGASVDRIAALTGVIPRTVWQHLAEWVEVERPHSISLWVDEETQRRVGKAVAEVGGELLKPVYEALNGTVRYEEIRVVRAFLAGSGERQG